MWGDGLVIARGGNGKLVEEEGEACCGVRLPMAGERRALQEKGRDGCWTCDTYTLYCGRSQTWPYEQMTDYPHCLPSQPGISVAAIMSKGKKEKRPRDEGGEAPPKKAKASPGEGGGTVYIQRRCVCGPLVCGR